jgi:hypothetical protein
MTGQLPAQWSQRVAFRLSILLLYFTFVFASRKDLPDRQWSGVRRCSQERGPRSRAHQTYVDRLDGKRIVFVGDSTVRYQYLELAYFLAHGVCPESDLLDEHAFDGWKDFYNHTSALLGHTTERYRTTEICLCARSEGWPVEPGTVSEDRHFSYIDNEVCVNGRQQPHAHLPTTIQCLSYTFGGNGIGMLLMVLCKTLCYYLRAHVFALSNTCRVSI